MIDEEFSSELSAFVNQNKIFKDDQSESNHSAQQVIGNGESISGIQADSGGMSQILGDSQLHKIL